MCENQKQFDKVNPKSMLLPDSYNDCLIGYEADSFIYCAKCIIDKLTIKFLRALQDGKIELYNDDYSIQQSASIYAEEHFEFNFINSIGKYYSIYKYKHEA